MSEKDDKKRALELALSQIEKQYGKGAIMKLGADERPADVPAIPLEAVPAPSSEEAAAPAPATDGGAEAPAAGEKTGTE